MVTIGCHLKKQKLNMMQLNWLMLGWNNFSSWTWMISEYFGKYSIHYCILPLLQNNSCLFLPESVHMWPHVSPWHKYTCHNIQDIHNTLFWFQFQLEWSNGQSTYTYLWVQQWTWCYCLHGHQGYREWMWTATPKVYVLVHLHWNATREFSN